MTKIKNTKKGMAKKTLSMSLVVAMLATSNVPVWAAEFSDGSDAATATEAPAAETFGDDTDIAPVVEDTTDDVQVATAASDYDFSGITVNDKMKNPTWAWKAEDSNSTVGTAPSIDVLFKTYTFTGTGTLQYVWAYNGAWEKPAAGANTITTTSGSGSLSTVNVPNTTELANHVNETLSLILVEAGTTTPIANFSFGTIQPVDLGTTGVTVSASANYNGAEQKPAVTIDTTSVSATYTDIKGSTADAFDWSYSGSNGLTEVGSNVTVSGTLKTANKLYTGSVKGNYTIGKYTITNSNLIVKVADTNKEITYTGNTAETVDNSLVNVYLPDAKDATKASDISLNEYIKKVTVNAGAITSEGRAGLKVTLDGAKLKKSGKFTNEADIELDITADNATTGVLNTVKIVPIDLAGVTATLKNPLKLEEVSTKALTANDTTTPIEVTVKGIGQYKGSLVNAKTDGSKLTFIIEKKDLKDCTVSVDKDLKATVMNGNVVEKKENFEIKDNGDGTATVSVVDGGKNYTGSVKVEIGSTKVGTPIISNVVVKGNTVTPVLSSEVDGAVGYDYVISTEEDYKNGRVGISKNILKTNTDFHYVQKGTYYAYCHAWTRGADGKKVFGEWSKIKKFTVKATTPSTPKITKVTVKGNTVTVTYTKSSNATGYDVILGSAVKSVNGEKRPVDYGTLVKKNIKGNVVTATFKNVPAGKYYAGVHSFNKTSEDGKKVFSKWSNSKAVTVK